MTTQMTTQVTGLTAQNVQGQDEYTASLISYIPSLIVCRTNSTPFDLKQAEAGDWYDMETSFSLSNKIRVVALDYSLQMAVTDIKKDEKIEYLRINKSVNFLSAPDRKAFEAKYADQLKYRIDSGILVLVHLPDEGMIRKIWFKGQMAKGGSALLQSSFVDGKQYSINLETVQKIQNKREWYTITTSISDIAEPVKMVEKYIELFNAVKSSDDDVKSQTTTAPTGRKI